MASANMEALPVVKATRNFNTQTRKLAPIATLTDFKAVLRSFLLSSGVGPCVEKIGAETLLMA